MWWKQCSFFFQVFPQKHGFSTVFLRLSRKLGCQTSYYLFILYFYSHYYDVKSALWTGTVTNTNNYLMYINLNHRSQLVSHFWVLIIRLFVFFFNPKRYEFNKKYKKQYPLKAVYEPWTNSAFWLFFTSIGTTFNVF